MSNTPRRLDNLAALRWTRSISEGFLLRVEDAINSIDKLELSESSSAEAEDLFKRNHDHVEKSYPTMHRAACDILVHLTELDKYWRSAPGKSVSLQHLLDSSMDYNTEVHPREDRNFAKHLHSLLIKVKFLDKPYIDRDYTDKDRMCVIPFAWLNFVNYLIVRLKPVPGQDLIVYGGLYPTITESLIESSPYLTSVSISHINITDDIILTLGQSCPLLQQLYLMHCFPWQVISLDCFCESFFCGASEKQIILALKFKKEDSVKITFKYLREMELSYGGEMKIAISFHKYLLYFYKKLFFRFSEWRSCLLDDGYGTYSKNIIHPIIKGRQELHVKALFFDGPTLFNFSPADMNLFSRHCPMVNDLAIHCSLKDCGAVGRSIRVVGRRLEVLVENIKCINSLQINVSEDDEVTKELIEFPILNKHGDNIESLTLEATRPGESIGVETLISFLDSCSNLKIFKIVVWQISMLYPLIRDAKMFSKRCLYENIEEFWIHDVGLGESGQLEIFRKLIPVFLNLFPKLFTFSLILCNELSPLLREIKTGAECVHLRIKDGFEWHPSVRDIHFFIAQQRNLKHLFLEELSWMEFWDIRQYYFNSSLNIHWGNLSGWPRS